MRRDEASRVEAARGDGGFVQAIVADGVLLLLATAASLVLAGGFAIFLAASGQFLPHDIAYLGMSAADLCTIADCRIVGVGRPSPADQGGDVGAAGGWDSLEDGSTCR
jgi:hypothetical protein